MKTFFLFWVLLFTIQSLNAQTALSKYTLDELTNLHQQAKSPNKKLQYAEAMLEKGKQELSAKDTTYALILYKVGKAHLVLRNIGEAEKYLEQAIAIQEEKAPESLTYASALNDLGIAYYYQGKFKAEEKLLLKAEQIQRAKLGESHPKYAKTLMNLAVLYMNLGTYEKAEQLFTQTIDIQKEALGEQHPDYASSLMALGILYRITEAYDKAEPLYLQALSIRKSILGEKHPKYIAMLNNLGNLYWSMKAFEKAKPLFVQTLKIQKEVLGENHPNYAASLNNLALLYSNTNEYEKAEKLYLEASELYKRTLGEKHPNYGASLNNLAQVYRDQYNYAQAIPLSLEALEIEKEILGTQHPDYIQMLNNLSELYMLSGQGELAWKKVLAAITANSTVELSYPISSSAISELEQANYATFKEIIQSLELVYYLLEEKKQRQTRLAITQLALGLLERSKNKLTEEEDKLRILRERARWVICALKLLDKEKEATKALSIVEQNKSVLLLDATSNKQAYISGLLPDSLIEREKTLKKQYAQTKAALARKQSPQALDSIRAKLNNLNLTLNRFQKKIEQDYAKYAKMRYAYDKVKPQEIQATLAPNTALLEYLVGDSVIYIFYVDQQQVNMYEFLISKKELSKRIQSLHSTLSNYAFIVEKPELAYRQYTSQAHWFYQKLVAPALTDVQDIKRLLIVTDGELGHLPFETFLVETAPQKVTDYSELHYLLRDYAISYNYSATLWKENVTAPLPKHNRQILSMAANYDIILDSSKTALRSPINRQLRSTLIPLPAARAEVEMLKKHFNGFFGFDGLATERIFKEKAGDFAVIHLAMHGLLDEHKPILSSLAFTEDADTLENNFLHAYEIAKMELNAELVILSACETGYGKFERGNGIASLARSFMYAGVPALIVSLWQVNDDATAMIMQTLYQNLAKGMPIDLALSQAKLSYIQSSRGLAAHPALWSPFVQIGKTEPISISRKGTNLFWWIGGGALLLLLGLGYWAAQKNKAA